ncbi:N-acetylglucosamine-6-phosphate deacetylase [Tepidibacter sp.]|jgi:N-acetylglucosamine-6-phosphate deacetylase|uniref:N-acetylglucosamine-6-phosphate deacetylase n=1 Tax=Tepidibacter sp. TaxID=2529387 RepID=UPI002FE6E5BA
MVVVKAIINSKIILEDKVLEDSVIIFNNKIVDIVSNNEFKNRKVDSVIDAKGNYLSAGFIDLHIHGAGGYDTMDATNEALNTISKTIIRNGVTSYLPTTMSMSKLDIKKALDNIRNIKITNGAKIIGVHLEGPFINPKYKGAQNEKYIIKPDYDFIKEYLDIIKIITFAPEKDENFEFMKKVKRHKNVVLSMGHTDATFEQAVDAIKNGVNYVTHAFNGMTGLHHRKPGVIGALFANDIYCEIIADTIHVHKGIFQSFIDINKKEKVILITDSMRAGCMKCGEYELGGQKVIVDEISARLKDNTLAGSILKLNNAVKNIRDNTKCKINEIINMVTVNPSKLIGLYNQIGSIEIGKVADLVIFDEDIKILKTIINGDTLYEVI